MTLKQAKRFYEFVVGQIVEDIDGTVCIRLLNGKLVEIPTEEKSCFQESKGFLCTFWMNKKSGAIKNLGTCGNEPQRLTESNVDFIWNVNFGDVV